ncbi:hypothetical protein CUMW_255210 [Citrus unshiu]|uniref:Uncharacterized protein n=1 Tax=Citrus unshiu TaxID=55188 RepID=A0A2H5QRL6_CITUN|nr:hypothetical protein CUMW_255210 [Citrus unshiu]
MPLYSRGGFFSELKLFALGRINSLANLHPKPLNAIPLKTQLKLFLMSSGTFLQSSYIIGTLSRTITPM